MHLVADPPATKQYPVNTPTDPLARKRRKKAGGNSGKNFAEGWVEFEDKAVAKRVAVLLNGQQMGGRRRSAYHYDLWTLKYLPKFKWDHLTEEIGAPLCAICVSLHGAALPPSSLQNRLTVHFGHEAGRTTWEWKH